MYFLEERLLKILLAASLDNGCVPSHAQYSFDPWIVRNVLNSISMSFVEPNLLIHILIMQHAFFER